MTNSVDPDETAHYEPSHLDLHCLHSYLFWSKGIKGLILYTVFTLIIGTDRTEQTNSGDPDATVRLLPSSF